jgi:exopolysaccharide biosynthesis polyprenyl glycosylphosphotransferase
MKLFGIPYTPRQVYFLLGDLGVAVIAIGLAHLLRLGRSLDASELARLPAGSLFFVSVSVLSLYVADAYNPNSDFRRPQSIIRLWLAVVSSMLLQMTFYFVFPEAWLGRGIAGLSALCFGFLLTGWRVLASVLRPGPVFRQRTLLVGDGDAEHIIAAAIRGHPEHEGAYDLVGCLVYPRYGHRRRNDDATDEPPVAPADLPVLGAVYDVLDVVQKHGVDLVIVAIRGNMSAGMAQRLLACKALGVQVEEMPSVYKRLMGKVPVLHLSDAWLLFGPVFAGSTRAAVVAERIADIVVSLVGLTLCAPIIALAAVAIKLETPGPAFFLQERLGRNEVPFRIVKLRTMGVDAEARTGAVWSQGAGDPRVTRVGRFLRRTRIDELPQFYNVLRGEMAMVGPRPERAHFVNQLKERIPFYALRFAVKPGVTGWAQVMYRYGASEEDAAEKLCYELFAIQELSPVLYLLILLKTVQTVLFKPGS